MSRLGVTSGDCGVRHMLLSLVVAEVNDTKLPDIEYVLKRVVDYLALALILTLAFTSKRHH